MCTADGNEEQEVKFTKLQISIFDTVSSLVKDLKLPYFHCQNSAGGLVYESKSSNFSRLGILLYGLAPSKTFPIPEGILPALEWKSSVAMIKRVFKGETVGYGCSYKAERDMKIAIIPVGYADGYSRKLSNKGYVIINSQKAYVVGRICMDQFMVDVTDIPNVKANDEVILIGKSGDSKVSADDLADMIGTIGYEVVCTISDRVSKIYKYKQ